jgi:hypothetical protein
MIDFEFLWNPECSAHLALVPIAQLDAVVALLALLA